MDEENTESETPKLRCCKLPNKEQWTWIYTVIPSVLVFLLHAASVLADLFLSCQLIWSNQWPRTGLATFVFIYVPVIFNLILKPDHPARNATLVNVFGWLFHILVEAVVYPVFVSVSLFKRLLWVLESFRDKKPHQEILNGYETNLPKEVHSYLFLQAFLQCAPQVIVQTCLVIMQLTTDVLTVLLQLTSILMGLLTLASCTMTFHRYEAQAVGGRTSLLLFRPPEVHTSAPLLPCHGSGCLPSTRVIALHLDSQLGKVVLFLSWFFLILGRLLCVLLSCVINVNATILVLAVHFFLLLLYLCSTQFTALSDVPSRIIHAIFAFTTLVEVCIRFSRVGMLYALFFLLILSEDCFFVILLYVYPTQSCPPYITNCSYLDVYAYIILNSHVLGVVLFGIYLGKLRPRRKSPASETTTIAVPSALPNISSC